MKYSNIVYYCNGDVYRVGGGETGIPITLGRLVTRLEFQKGENSGTMFRSPRSASGDPSIPGYQYGLSAHDRGQIFRAIQSDRRRTYHRDTGVIIRARGGRLLSRGVYFCFRLSLLSALNGAGLANQYSGRTNVSANML